MDTVQIRSLKRHIAEETIRIISRKHKVRFRCSVLQKNKKTLLAYPPVSSDKGPQRPVNAK